MAGYITREGRIITDNEQNFCDGFMVKEYKNLMGNGESQLKPNGRISELKATWVFPPRFFIVVLVDFSMFVSFDIILFGLLSTHLSTMQHKINYKLLRFCHGLL